MRRFLNIFFFILISFVFANSDYVFGFQQYQDIKIIESNSNRLVIEYSPIYLKQKIFKNELEIYDVIDFVNSIQPTARGIDKFIGSPTINFRKITVCLPTLNNNSVRILSSDYETLHNVNIAPIPKHNKTEDSLSATLVYEKDLSKYRSSDFFPEEITILNEIGIARENILGNLILYPLQYNPAKKELKKYKRIRIEIVFGSSNPPNIMRTLTVGKETENPLNSLVINYDQLKNWKVRDISFSKKNTNQITNSVLASGDWYKIEIKDEGIYKLDASYLKNAGISLSGLDPRTVKIYGNGGEEISENTSAQRITDLLECAIYVSGESDGVFNDNDFVLFYAKGPTGWKYSSSTKKFSHYINHYSNSNYYFLTFGGSVKGKRMESQVSLSSQNPVSQKSIVSKYFIEPEMTNFVNSGLEWFGLEINSNSPSINYLTAKFDGIVTDTPITYRVQCAARSIGPSSFNLEQNNQLLGVIRVYTGSDFGYGTGNYAEKSDIVEFMKKTNITDNKLNFKLTYLPLTSSDKGFLDWIEVFYNRSLSTGIDEISFSTPEINSTLEYSLDGFSSSNIFAMNVNDHNNVKMISGSSVSGGNIRFQVNATLEGISNYYVVGNNGLKIPAQPKKILNSNLHGITDGGEFIIVTHPDFLSKAEEYKNYRESTTKNNLKTKVINVDAIYNEFSGGLVDPTSIRDFVRYAFDNWTTKPNYLLLFGDATFDFRSNSKINVQDKNRVPTYETLESLYQIETFCTDDYFVRIIGNDNRNDLAVGRIPVTTTAEASAAITKIKEYESSDNYGSWRNTVTFVADDGFTSTGDDGDRYTTQSEELAETMVPVSFEKKKIFIVAYKTVVSSTGRKKPDANQAIIDHLNYGTLLMNYIGHGNPEQWAHEDIFNRSVSIPALQNRDKLALVVAATCDFGRYDQAQKQSGTEELLLKSDGGSISSFCTSRSVFADENYFISRAFYRELFTRDNNRLLRRMGDIVYVIKQEYMTTNDNKFQLIGDPTIRLNAPQYLTEIDSINGKSVDNQIQLKALSKVTVKGKILKDTFIPYQNYSGKILITLNDASRTVQISEGYGNFSFLQSGGILYRGECTIKDGNFASTFYIPKDISYENNYGRINLYFQGSENDGAGYNQSIVIGGTDTTGTIDDKGPVINVYISDRNFRNGDLVGENPTMIVDLYDENGINVSGGIGHRFQAWLDNDINGINLDSYYKGKIDSYQEGSAEYKLSNLSNGTHLAKVKAFDVFNNSSTKEVEFKVSGQTDLTIQNVVNYPNPFSKNTKFTFQQNQDNAITVIIKIYTIAGRLIKTIHEYGITNHFVQIEWDGRDEEGDELANGVYLYKLISKTGDGKFTSESLGKLSVLK